MNNFDILERMNNQFMVPEITREQNWYIVEDGSTYWYPADYFSKEELLQDYPKADIEVITGIGARLSAPGYLDSTDWVVFDTAEEAAEYLVEMFALEEDYLD